MQTYIMTFIQQQQQKNRPDHGDRHITVDNNVIFHTIDIVCVSVYYKIHQICLIWRLDRRKCMAFLFFNLLLLLLSTFLSFCRIRILSNQTPFKSTKHILRVSVLLYCYVVVPECGLFSCHNFDIFVRNEQSAERPFRSEIEAKKKCWMFANCSQRVRRWQLNELMLQHTLHTNNNSHWVSGMWNV